MRFLLRVTVEDVTDQWAVLAGVGAQPALPDVGPVWHDPWTATADGGVTSAATDPHPGTDFAQWFALIPRERLDDVASAAARGERQVAGSLALEALRIAAWRPRFAHEVDARTIPHELDWLRSAVHLAKGCYRGQETVAKVHNLGRPPRRLVQLDLDGSEAVLPVPGDAVLHDDQEVGVVTSSALHHEDGPIALAVVKRSVPEAANVAVRTADADVAAAQRIIVPADAGPAVAVPRLPRLGAVRRG
jgi:folate-binding protein YgfZ